MTVRTELLRHHWQSRTLWTWLLWPVSWLMRLAVAWRRALYTLGLFNRQRLPVPVVVVGNVLLGGVGKTPVVMALVTHLQARGVRVGVISRGHGREDSGVYAVDPTSSTAQEAGDEALLIAQRCRVPVVVANDRPAAGRHLLTLHPETQVILSDDGLQHLALQHDLALCVFDERGLGNGWVFPAGPLREPWPRASDVPQWVLSSATPSRISGRVPQGAAFVLSRRLADTARNALGERRPLSHWRMHACHALAAIAKPEVFFDMLRQQGVQPMSTVALPDHAPLCAATLPALHEGDWLCTEKDAVKLWSTHPQAWAVPLEVELPSDFLGEFDAALSARLSSAHGHQTA